MKDELLIGSIEDIVEAINSLTLVASALVITIANGRDGYYEEGKSWIEEAIRNIRNWEQS